MTLWRRTRTEMAGAWRSLRYDLGRRPEPLPARGREPEPDVTSTGMSTFGGVTGSSAPAYPPAQPGYREPARPGRALTAVGAVLTLAVVGVAGSYLAVVTGLGGL
ncbi:MAG TPA: hypothetical protein VFH03_10780, partial [Actinoplanes sp.]|nr:hypothetical protein [Actinoplanes sp.]